MLYIWKGGKKKDVFPPFLYRGITVSIWGLKECVCMRMERGERGIQSVEISSPASYTWNHRLGERVGNQWRHWKSPHYILNETALK